MEVESINLPLVLKDATNETIEFNQRPKRIVSLTPSVTEVLYALGEKDDLVAVTRYCPFPELLKTRDNIGTVLSPDVEKVISLEPDIVFATVEGNRLNSINALRNSGVKVFVFGKVSNFNELFNRIGIMGSIVQSLEKTDALMFEMRRRLELINKKVSAQENPRKVFLQMGLRPLITVNENTIMNEVIELAGGENIAKEALIRYPIYSRESVVAQDPDVIIITSMGQFEEDAIREWREHTSIKAVRNGRIYVVNPDLICHIGPRLVEGVEKVAELLYPELIKGAE